MRCMVKCTPITDLFVYDPLSYPKTIYTIADNFPT